MRDQKLPTNVLKFNPNEADPVVELLQLLKKSLSARVPEPFCSILLAVILTLLLFGTVAVAALAQGIFTNFRDDIAAPIQFGLLNPLTIVLVLLYYRQVETVFNAAQEYVDIPDVELSKLKSWMQGWYQSRVLLLLSGFSALMGTSGFFYVRYSVEGAYYFGCYPIPCMRIGGLLTISGLLTFMWGALVTYIVVVWGCKNIITVLGFLRLFTFSMNYQPLHTDARAGLGKVGSLFSLVGFIVLIVGITLVVFLVPLIKSQPQTAILWGVPYGLPYLILPLLLYVFSIYAIHRKMIEGKKEFLEQLVAKEFSSAGSRGILDYYKLIKELPEWPLSFQGVLPIVGSLTLLAGQFLSSEMGKLIPKIWEELKKVLPA